jgi:hypothetical protein
MSYQTMEGSSGEMLYLSSKKANFLKRLRRWEVKAPLPSDDVLFLPSSLVAGMIVVASALLGGCAATGVTSTHLGGLRSVVLDEPGLLSVNTVAVAPVVSAGDDGALSEAELTQEVVDAMREEWGSEVISASEGSGDGVFAVRIRHLTSLKGSAVGAMQPAEVECEMTLRNMRTKRVVWQGSYVFNDRPLSDNLLQLKKRQEGGGSGWKSEHVLLRSAFRAAAREVAAQRERLFLRRDG